ncbi:MAG: DUF2599 domain-containing protein [Dietzia sp.]
MRPDSARSLMAAAALLAVAAAGGCSDAGTGPEAGPSEDEATSSSSPVVPPPQASPTAPVPLIASTTWADSDFGVTLKVAPTPAGREAWGALDADSAWQEVLQLAPDAGTPGMREQFDCHWTWARILEPDKRTWNLEPWRPVVADEQMLAEGCNPGGPEV